MKINELFQKVIKVAPEFYEIYGEHLKDNGELLEFVLMADLTRFVKSLQEKILSEKDNNELEKKLTSILEVLEEGLAGGDVNVEDVIYISFLEQLSKSEIIYIPLKNKLPQNLLKNLKEIENL